MISVLNKELELECVGADVKPTPPKRKRKASSSNKGSTSKRGRKTATEVVNDVPKKELFSYDEKKKYCDAKYGRGNWSFMTKEECLQRFREDRERKLIQEELKNDSRRRS